MDIPVTIVGGYLGAGKTTLINHILTSDHGLRIAVLVNDFGAVNIDASLISAESDDTISLTNGCVCCSIHDDLGAALDLQTRRASPPDHIVIETSGVAEPARILTYATGWPGIRLDAVVTLVDAETIRARADDKFVGRVVRRQLAAADFLVVNKTDLVTESDRRGLSRWLADVTPDARLIEAVHGNAPPALLFEGARLPARSDQEQLSPDAHGGQMFTTQTIPLTVAVNIESLTGTLRALPASIHRVKGFVTDEGTGQRMLVQSVGDRLSIVPAVADSAVADARPTSGDVLVAIGLDAVDLRAVSNALAALAG